MLAWRGVGRPECDSRRDPEPTAAPTVAATPSASTAAAASASAQPDPAIGLKIDTPYKLTALDPRSRRSSSSQFTQGAGAFGSLVGVWWSDGDKG